MINELHYRALERMYLSAPLNQFYQPMIQIEQGKATVAIDLDSKFFHSGGAVHGSVYFKLLDDSAFFAAASQEPEFFVLTTSFTTYLTRPVSSGKMSAIGQVVNANKSQFICESIVYDDQQREIGRGNGIFVRSKNRLDTIVAYCQP